MRFEDLTAGQQLEFGSICVSESEIIDFANRYDPQPFHMDPAAARESRWGGIIASGFHTCGIAMRLVAEHVLRGSDSIGSPGMEYVRWLKPVRPGDCLRMQVNVLSSSVSTSGRVGAVRWQWLLINQADEPVLDLIVTSLFARNPTSQSGN